MCLLKSRKSYKLVVMMNVRTLARNWSRIGTWITNSRPVWVSSSVLEFIWCSSPVLMKIHKKRKINNQKHSIPHPILGSYCFLLGGVFLLFRLLCCSESSQILSTSDSANCPLLLPELVCLPLCKACGSFWIYSFFFFSVNPPSVFSRDAW